MTGGTWTGGATAVLRNNLELAGTITISANVNFNTGTLKRTSGTITASSTTLTSAAATTFDLGAVTFSAINLNGSVTFTLSSSLNCSGQLTLTNSTTFTGAFDVNCGNLNVASSVAVITMSGNINSTGTISSGAATSTTFNGAFNVNASGSVTVGTNWSGTATLNYTGTGTFSGATSASILAMNTTINTAGATFSTGFNYRTNTFTITALGSSTYSSFTFFISTGSPTLTVNVSGFAPTTFQTGVATNITVNGTNGFTMGTFSCSSAAVSKVTWQIGNAYVITSGISVVTTLANAMVWVSSSPGTRYTMTLQNGATNDVGFANITDADNSAGRIMWVYKGTLSNNLNINPLPTTPVCLGT